MFKPTISVKSRFLWAVLLHQEETIPGRPLSLRELESILRVKTETLLRYFRELEENGCVVFKVEYGTRLPKAEANEEVSTFGYVVAPGDPRHS